MRYLLLLILCCFSSFLYGQSDFAMIDTLVEQGQLDQAVERLTVLTENTTPETTAGAWQRIGSIRREQSDYNGAIEALQQAEDILKKASPQSEILPNVYYQLAAVYSEIGDVEKALNYLNQQIALSRQIHGELSEATGNGYLQMTKIGYQLGDWEMAREGALKVLDIYQSIFPADHIKVANAYNNAGLTYELGFNEYEKALDYYQKALAIKKSKLGEEHPSTNKTLINIAYIYRKVKKDYATALQLYQQNLSVLRKRYGEKQTDVAVAYYTLASTYLEMEEADSALYYAQRAMVAAHPTFESLDYKEEPRQLPAIVTDYLIDILGIKAGAFALRFKQQGAEKDLQRSLEVHQAAIEVALQIRDYFRSSAESKLILQEYLYPLYEQALEVAYQGWSQFGKEEYLKAAFRFMEQSKSLLLNQAFRQVNASAIAQVPASIKEKGEFYKSELLSKQLDTEQQIALKLEYDAWLKQLKKDYPEYYKLSYGYEIIDWQQLQSELSAETTLITYFVGDKDVYGMQMDRLDANLVKLEKGSALAQKVQDLRAGITDFYTQAQVLPQSDLEKQYQAMATELYQSLLAPFGKLPPRLIIVPDGCLGYLPFEALQKEGGRYLIEDHTVSYANSATLLSEMKSTKIKANGSWLGLAPVFEEAQASPVSLRKQFAALPYSGREVSAIQQMIGGEALIGADANLSNLLARGQDYRCIHLSTHSQFDDEDASRSMIALHDTVLYAADLYARRMPADLVVLSACETGVGTVQRGEGMLSMARAFIFAGAKSLLTTLWPVKDGTTARFMEIFYQYLQEGDAKDVALRKAKLQFIEQGEAPYFWAAYVVNGDTVPIPFHRQSWSSYWWAGLLLVGGMIYFFIKMRNP